MKTHLIALATLTLVGCGAHAPPEDDAPPPTPVHCEAVAEGAVPVTRTMRGVITGAPESATSLAPQLAGRLARVLVREGDVVVRNQLLAEVEARPLRELVAESRARLAQARATGSNDSASLARERRLVDQGIGARHTLEAAAVAEENSQAGVNAAAAALAFASTTADRAALRAPFGGVVIRVYKRVGELVDGTSATPVIELADPGAEELVASVTPTDLAELTRGQRGVLALDALPESAFDVTVRSFAPVVDHLTGLGTVRFSIAATDRPPALGLYGAVTVEVGRHEGALTVRSTALRNPGPDGSEVIVCEGTTARVRVVAVGARAGGRVEILRGLEPRTRVVVDEVVGLEDGATLQVLP